MREGPDRHRNLDLERERSLLGALLLDGGLARSVMPEIDPENFAEETLRDVAAIMHMLVRSGQAVSLASALEEASFHDDGERLRDEVWSVVEPRPALEVVRSRLAELGAAEPMPLGETDSEPPPVEQEPIVRLARAILGDE